MTETSDFITCVRIEEGPAHSQVTVWIRGQSVGTLVCGADDADRIRNALVGAKYFGTDRSSDGPVRWEEQMEWRVLATNWLDVNEIITGPTGMVGRIVLRLLDALHAHGRFLAQARTVAEHWRDQEGVNTTEIDRLVETELEYDMAVAEDETVPAERPREKPHTPALVKDFHVLYRTAQAALEALPTVGESRANAVGALRAQLLRLLPAFEECEATRRMGRPKEGG